MTKDRVDGYQTQRAVGATNDAGVDLGQGEDAIGRLTWGRSSDDEDVRRDVAYSDRLVQQMLSGSPCGGPGHHSTVALG